MQLQANQLYLPDYDAERTRCAEFITTFQDPRLKDPIHGKLKYMAQLQQVANRQAKVVQIEIDDVKEFFSAARDSHFCDRMRINTSRYIDLFAQVIDQAMPKPSVNFQERDQLPFDILMEQRRFNIEQTQHENLQRGIKPTTDKKVGIPEELSRRYQVFIVQGEFGKKHIDKMREVKAQQIGQLVTIRGIVVRCSDVKPQMQVAVYVCDVCGFEVYQVISQKQFNPLVECPSEKCKINKVRGELAMQIRGSKFVSFQDIKIQEPSDQVPVGHVPRTMKIRATGENTRKCMPGDNICVTGVFLPQAFFGFRAPGLTQDTFLEAFQIVKEKKSHADSILSDERMGQVMDIKHTTKTDMDLLERLAESICPEIWGMLEVKQALLLQMVSGNTKVMADGMKIRGNINVLLMGDPGVAKSQLLKYITVFAPRGIYTTGKGSSGVGLTASVRKDNVTGELVLEGGALVLADTGICAIDEFDKMDERDRTNIHEVMEQQTVSIAKAGITTQLNARTSVLAAANPQYGRYNMKLKPHENINLPPALLSRFDLIFLLLDRSDMDSDKKLAFHVAQVHKHTAAPKDPSKHQVPAELMRAFIAHAQTFDPVIPADLHNYIVAKYVEKRKFQREGSQDSSYLYVTPRTLLGIIRLAQAMAKLCFRNVVCQGDVDEALKLMDFSFRTLRKETGDKKHDREAQKEQQKNDKVSLIMDQVRRVWEAKGRKAMPMNMILDQINRRDTVRIDKQELWDTLQYYASLSVVYVDKDENVMYL